MRHVKLVFDVPGQDWSDILTAELGSIGYDIFEEQDGKLITSVKEEDYNEEDILAITTNHNISFVKELVEAKNWNEEWERDFKPVIVDDFCTVRADFHNMEVNTPYEIIVTPKMSFGTGHHATTQLVIKEMQYLDFKGKKVLDFGTGTGVLAILAEKLGATSVVAIDNDEWSFENAKENTGRNSCTNTEVLIGSLEDIKDAGYDIILANINRNILLHYMAGMFGLLNNNTRILMSGLMPEDADVIINAAIEVGFIWLKKEELNNWIVLLFEKK